MNKKEILSYIIYIGAVGIFSLMIIKFVGQRTVVHGDSMEATLQDGDQLIMDKIGYRFHDPERFDVIVFPGLENDYYIKRIIGLPGETVQIIDGKVYINGKLLKDDTYGITDYIDEPGIAGEPLTLGKDEYFCMGDNRPVSLDSRYPEVGPVERSEILGRAWVRVFPAPFIKP